MCRPPLRPGASLRLSGSPSLSPEVQSPTLRLRWSLVPGLQAPALSRASLRGLSLGVTHLCSPGAYRVLTCPLVTSAVMRMFCKRVQTICDQARNIGKSLTICKLLTLCLVCPGQSLSSTNVFIFPQFHSDCPASIPQKLFTKAKNCQWNIWTTLTHTQCLLSAQIPNTIPKHFCIPLNVFAFVIIINLETQ